MKKTGFFSGLATVLLGFNIAGSAQANCNTQAVVNEVLDVAAIIGTVNTAVNVSQAVIRPLADMWSDPNCQAQLGISAEEARVIAQEVVVGQERRNIQETLRRAGAIMNDYDQQCLPGREDSCIDYVVTNALRDAENLASGEDNAIAHGFLLADTMEALVANRLSLMTLWARARIEQNDETGALSESDLKNQIRSVFQNRLGLSYTRMVDLIQNYRDNINWVLDENAPVRYFPIQNPNGSFKAHRYCYNFQGTGKAGCSSGRDKRKKARKQAYDRRLTHLEHDLELREVYFTEAYRNVLFRVSQATAGFDTFYEQSLR